MPAAARYAPMADQPEDAGGDAQLARLNTADVAAMIDEELEDGFGGDELDRLRSRAPRTAQERRRDDLMLSVEVQGIMASPLSVAVAEDTNAVLCPEYRAVALFGKLPRWALVLLQLPVFALLVTAVKLLYVEQVYAAASSEASFAHTLNLSSMLVFYGPLATMLPGLHDVSRRGGQLELLGSGTVKISVRQKRHLGRWYVATCISGLFWLITGCKMALGPVLDPERAEPREIDRMLAPERGWDVDSTTLQASYGLARITISAPILSLWLFSLYLGASLAADAVDEVIQRIEELSPTELRWEEEVEHGGVKLAEETMEWLSSGWATGVALFFATFWTGSAGWGVTFAVWRRPEAFIYVCISAVLPLLVCYPLAVTSSKCDDLLSALNTKSLRYVAYTWSARDEEAVTRSHRDTHLRLQALQQGLRQLNYDQVRRLFL